MLMCAQKMMVLLIGLCSASVFAEELRIYGFTSSFVDCVKKHHEEERNYSKSGAAQSALMNGSSVLSGSELDGQFWQYMDCLTPASSGVDSRTLVQTTACPELDINLGDRRIYVPPSVNGKEFKLGGASWVCDNGVWGRSGTGVDVTESPKPCPSSQVSVGSCQFDVPSKPHGSSFWAQSIPASASGGEFLSGESLFSCQNGAWAAVQGSSTCDRQVCDGGQTMTWSGNALSQCSGVIDHSGVAEQVEMVPRYFTTLKDAMSLTKLVTGRAEYTCTNRGWKLISATCAQKNQANLSCSSRLTAIGTVEYSCR